MCKKETHGGTGKEGTLWQSDILEFKGRKYLNEGIVICVKCWRGFREDKVRQLTVGFCKKEWHPEKQQQQQKKGR